MAGTLKLPVGIDSFEKIRRNDFYYVDKTALIGQLLNNWSEVNLFTRPRRFGKTLNMSMLRCFFEIGADPSLFDGLYISRNTELCEKYMGKFPVIFLSLKGVDGLAFEEAEFCLAELIETEARRFKFLLNSKNLDAPEKEKYRKLLYLHGEQNSGPGMELRFALQVLSELLTKHYGQKTVILIDEYDVPLYKAFQHGYYREMTALIRGLFGQALKSNDFLEFAVLTGCLRVSKESIFTGLNNFKVLSITDMRFAEQFGFTEKEVKELLAAYHLESHISEIKEWYDGYRFGNAGVYCPWDVINHVDTLLDDPEAEPRAYWINTSGNDLVKRFICRDEQTTREEIEQLINGECIEKQLRQELTYDEVDSSTGNLWSVLFITGYLTLADKPHGDIYKLKIPNEEVRRVYEYQIREWFSGTFLKSMNWLPDFWHAFEEGNAKQIEERLTQTLGRTISVFDIRKPEPENSYHAFLLGMLAGNAMWGIESNREGGEGRPDIVIRTGNPDTGIIIEIKKADAVTELDRKCGEALDQIRERHYDDCLRNDGRDEIRAYGIAFYKKRCRVFTEKINTD